MPFLVGERIIYCVVFDASKERAAACDEALQAIDDCHTVLRNRSRRGNCFVILVESYFMFGCLKQDLAEELLRFVLL
jgi:hypothetical protein